MTEMDSPTNRYIHLNVGGKSFMTTADTLASLPDTRLGRLARDEQVTSQPDVELFFDRNPDIMNSLLDLYRSGEFHLPKHLCGKTVEQELEFWDIPVTLVRECCFQTIEQHQEDATVTAKIDEFMSSPYEAEADFQRLSKWNRIWLMMERPTLNTASKIWSIIYFSVVVLSALFYTLETSMTFREIVPTLKNSSLLYCNESAGRDVRCLSPVYMYGVTIPVPWLLYSKDAVLFFFVLEYFVRFITCPSRLQFMKQVKNNFDLLLVFHNTVAFILKYCLPLDKKFTAVEVNGLIFFYSLDVLRILRIFYIAKNLDMMKVLLLSTKASMRVLLLLALCVVSLSCMFGAAVYLAELLTGHYTFTSILYGMWYAIVTMTTVGYGDVVPESWPGRLLGTVCTLFGVVVMALPIAVIASKFTTYHDNLSSRKQKKRREAFIKSNPCFFKSSGMERRQSKQTSLLGADQDLEKEDYGEEKDAVKRVDMCRKAGLNLQAPKQRPRKICNVTGQQPAVHSDKRAMSGGDPLASSGLDH